MPSNVQDGAIVLVASAKEGDHIPQKFKLRPGQKLNCLAKSYCKFRQLRPDAGVRVTMSTKKFWVLDEHAEPIKYGLRNGDTVFFEVHGANTASAASNAMSRNSHSQPQKRLPQSIALASESEGKAPPMKSGIPQPCDAKKTISGRYHIPSNPEAASGKRRSASAAKVSRRYHVPFNPRTAGTSGQHSSASANPETASGSGQRSSASGAKLSRRVHVPSNHEAANTTSQRSSESANPETASSSGQRSSASVASSSGQRCSSSVAAESRRVHVTSNPEAASSSGQISLASAAASVASSSAQRSSASVATVSRRVHGPSKPEAASSSSQRTSGSLGGKQPVNVTIWWSCPSCDYTIGMSKKPRLRANLKYCHIRNRHPKLKTAKTKNFKARASMYRAIWNGKLKKSSGGLTKEDLCVSHRGRIVPKRRSEHSKKIAAESGWAENWRTWCKSSAQVRTELGTRGFVLPKRNGTPDQKNLHKKISERWAEKKIAAVNKALSKAGSPKVMGWIHRGADSSDNSP